MAETGPEKEQETKPFNPRLFYIELRMTVILVVTVSVFGILGQMHPIGLGAPADPLSTPEHIKPEWYFLGLYQVLKFIPKTAGALLPILGLLPVVLWPFIDRKPDISRHARWMRLGLAAALIIVAIAFTVWGALS
ncbi:MAG: hypothetical protein JXB30_14500 [Anaerolineae bacterium]|nr:hypothetical protein [Anaerolineae bacterium]